MGGGAADDGDEGPDGPDADQAASDAGEGAHHAAESVERAMAVESHSHEQRPAEAPATGSRGDEPDSQS